MLLDIILGFADEYEMFPQSGLVLACVSGGADSMCMLEALLDISRGRGFSVAVAHYNHGLRGEESVRDEGFVREYCLRRGVPFFSGCGDVAAHAEGFGIGIEEAARDMRYGFFYDTAAKTGAERIATAHTADDNAETVIMNLARGAGANGLSGIPPVWGKIIRPMLRVSRGEILVFLSDRGVPFVEDSSNSLDIYTRNKIRHAVIPVIREINPRFNEAVAVATELLRADEEYLSGLAEAFFVKQGRTRQEAKQGDGSSAWRNQADEPSPCLLPPTLRATSLEEGGKMGDEQSPCFVSALQLLELPFAVSGRVIRKICGRGVSYGHVKAVLELCRQENPSASLSLPGMTVFREYDHIVFAPHGAPMPSPIAPVYPTVGKSFIIPGIGLKISCKSVLYDDTINKSFTSFLFKHNDVYGKISVRSRREGDTIRLFDQKNTKTLKKLFIERRIPARNRALIPIVADDKGVLAIYGIGIGDRAVPKTGDLAVQIIFEEI